jgi:phosphotriesterase-related protein
MEVVELNIAGKIQTVLGTIGPDELGVTLTHEHLLIDLSVVYETPASASEKGFFNSPVSLETLGRIRHHGAVNADNARLEDIDTAIDETNLYRQYGGASLLEVSSMGLSRDPIGLARISRATEVNVIMGASYYVAAAHPPDMASISEDEIVAQIVRDVTEGADGTDIRSGVIGEVGCSWPLTDNERKVLQASARAQTMTGAPLLIHPGRDETAPMEIIGILAAAGADLDRTIMGHIDRTALLHDTRKQIADAGCYLNWDLFGREESYYPSGAKIDMPNDATRMDDISAIISEGFGGKVLVAHDICSKHRLMRYGGHGYHYILAHIVPRMRVRGFSNEAIDDILVNNPRDVLTFVEPGG